MAFTSRFTEHFDLDESQLCLVCPPKSTSSSTTSLDLLNYQSSTDSSPELFEKATFSSSSSSTGLPISFDDSNQPRFPGKLKRFLTIMSKKKKSNSANSE